CLVTLSGRYLMAGSRRAAAICGQLATCLHPSRAMRFYAAVLQGGALPGADPQVAAYRALKRGASGQETALLHCSIAMTRAGWAGVLDRSRGMPSLTQYYIRALGELGRVEDMIAAFATWRPKPLRGHELDECRLTVLAFAGRVEGVRALLRRKLRFLRAETAA